MSALDDRVAALAPVPLDELVAEAALLTRVDRKYVLPLADAERVVAALPAGTRVLEIGGHRGLRYETVYFDTPDLLSFRLAAHGRRRRFKLRTRSYLDTGSTFLEMKTRGARGSTQKDRDAYADAVPDRLTPAARDEVALALDAIGIPAARADDLDSRLRTLYRRATLLLPGEGGGPSSRATVDLDLEWVDATGRGFLLPRFAIVETKSPGQAGRLDRALWRAGHRPQRISKYATGLAALHRRRDLAERSRRHRLNQVAAQIGVGLLACDEVAAVLLHEIVELLQDRRHRRVLFLRDRVGSDLRQIHSVAKILACPVQIFDVGDRYGRRRVYGRRHLVTDNLSSRTMHRLPSRRAARLRGRRDDPVAQFRERAG